MYSRKVMDHFLHPRNMGKMKNADVTAQVGNPVCGDVMKIYLKIGKKGGKEYIKDIKFQTLGCTAAIATSSMMTEMVKGKPLDQAAKISNQAIAQALGGLPPVKMHCSVLAQQVLKKAIEKWGTDSQILMFFEEVGELMQAISKIYRDKGKGEYDLAILAEEIADVEIMLEQLKVIFGVEELARNIYRLKLKRLEEMLND